jgi:hypothetical protein
MFNSGKEAREFVVPEPAHDSEWCRVIDTAADSPYDFYEPGFEPDLGSPERMAVRPRAMAVLRSRL